MSDDNDSEVPEGRMLNEDADEMAVNESAMSINEFLYRLGIGCTPLVAFELAVDGETSIRLSVPSNLRIEVLP